jgi:hypothetical protein
MVILGPLAGGVSRAAVSGSVVAAVLRLCEGSGQDDRIR